jgi:tRNA(Ile)-lysidine synthase TilS/MesJ
VRKVKPLWRVSEVETAAYGFLKGIDYVTEECPMSEDATSLVYKEALSRIEDRMPGTRIVFYQGFLDPSNPLRSGPEAAVPADAVPKPEDAPAGGIPRATEADAEEGVGTPRACASCGAPTYTETCSFCRLKERVRKARSLRAARSSR